MFNRMKLRERLIYASLCILPVIFLMFNLYNEIKQMKSLQIKIEARAALKRNSTITKITKNTRKFVVKSPKTHRISETAVRNSNKTKAKENKFKDLHNYSLYNPNFRDYMEWPPFYILPQYNPNLAEIWNVDVKPDKPNWEKFHSQISKYYLYEDSPLIEALLHDIATQKIVAVDEHPAGTQFKLIVTFEDGGRALFKPQRYPRERETDENVFYFDDFERHVSEIAAFHLDRILEFRRAPPVVGRKVNVTGELYRLASTDDFLDTFYRSPDRNYCFYGTCKLYCDPFHGFCGDPHMIEGSFAAYLPASPHELLDQGLIPNPWQRSYMPNVKTKWEKDPTYCRHVLNDVAPFNDNRRIFDAIDAAIFDFLIGNQDRHTYDEFKVFGNETTLIHMDNGRGFGRANHDELSIIAPLTQCCIVRLSTFHKLYSFYVGPQKLSSLMRKSLAKDPVAPILTEPHLQALDRRVEEILTAIQSCVKLNGPSDVFFDNIV